MALVPAFYSWCNVIVNADGNILVQDRSGRKKKQIRFDQVVMIVVRPKVSHVTIVYSDPEILVNVPNSTKVFLKDRCEVLDFVLSFVEISPELKQKVALQKNLGMKPKPNRTFRAEELKRFIFS